MPEYIVPLDDREKRLAVALLSKNIMAQIDAKITEISQLYIDKFNSGDHPNPEQTFTYQVNCEIKCAILYDVYRAIKNHSGEGNGDLQRGS